LCGETPYVNAAIFSPDWFTGVSLLQLKDQDGKYVESQLENEKTRSDMLQKLKAAIPSEVADPALQVGPSMDCDEYERDVEETTWKFGFDTSSSFVGLFSAEHSRAPENGKVGLNRVHKEFFIVCKAGAGVCASTFHSRFLESVKKGLSIDAIFSDAGPIGPQGLRRIGASAIRNRHRTILAAREALGLQQIESIGDQASRNKYRGAVVDVDVVVNSLRKLDDCRRSTWQFCSGVDGVLSKGLLALSNASDGLVLFLHSSGEKRISLKNETWASIPFCTERLVSGRDMVAHIKEVGVHCDDSWVRKRFGWKNRPFKSEAEKVMPFCLWGSHNTEQFTKTFSRELGISDLNAVRLRPELVCTAGVESGKLRALL
jgi:hypothetical protein